MALKSKKKQQVNPVNLSGLLDVLSPMGIDFQSKSIQVGELYQRALVITDYPPRVNAAWLSKISTMPGVVLSLHTYPTDPFKLLDQIKVVMGELAGRLEQGGNPFTLKRAEDQYKDSEMLLEKIDREQQKVMYFVAVILVSAFDQDTLNQRTRKVESALAASGMRGRAVVFKQEEAFLSSGPWALLHPDIDRIGARNMPVESIAAAFPFVYSGLNDGDGVLLGMDKQGGIVLVDFWIRSADRTNSNMTILGRPGVGKSTAVKKGFIHEYSRGTKIIVVDPEREYKDLCENLGGTWIDCGGGVKGRINPLQVRSVPLDDEEDMKDPNYVPLYSPEIAQRGPLALHFQTLKTFFRLYLRDISKSQMARLELALEEVYKKFGITWTTDPKTIPNEKWPIMKDLYEHVVAKFEETQDKSWEELALLLRSAAVGADSALWSGHSTIEADSEFICLDIHYLLEADEEVRRAQFFNVLSWAWNEVSKDRNEKVILGTDETYLLVDPEVPQALAFLRNTSKRIRKYEGALWVITHNLVDFLDDKVRRYGQALVDNPVYKLIMGQGDKDIEALEKLMTLSEKEVQTLAEGKRGEALFVAGNRRLHLKINISPYEVELFGKAGGR